MKKLILFLLLLVSCQIILAKEFNEINKLLSERFDQKKWQKALEDELSLHEEGNQHKNLLHARYIEAFMRGGEGDENMRISKLLWVIEHAKKEDFEIYAYSNYHLASTLSNVGSNNLALRYSREALKKCLENKINKLLHLNYSLEGAIHYKLKNYEDAIDSYFKALKNNKTKDYLFRASMFNNISLCKMNQHKLDESNIYIQKSLSNLAKIKKPNTEVILFKIIVEGNLGTNYFIQKRY